jgi:hypothetical protein
MIKITKGEKKVFQIDLRQSNGRPFDLTPYDRFKVEFPLGSGAGLLINQTANGNGSVVSVLGNSILGILQVTVGPNDTKLLTPGERLYIDLEIDNGSTPAPKRERFIDALNVIDSNIP